ncbi:hypothetical protein AA313_de0208041 [Arthrobotrys entomopaga]|nr:hypothetical protein AA313_de0208041 [Arthrobotrys entomopaga]
MPPFAVQILPSQSFSDARDIQQQARQRALDAQRAAQEAAAEAEAAKAKARAEAEAEDEDEDQDEYQDDEEQVGESSAAAARRRTRASASNSRHKGRRRDKHKIDDDEDEEMDDVFEEEEEDDDEEPVKPRRGRQRGATTSQAARQTAGPSRKRKRMTTVEVSLAALGADSESESESEEAPVRPPKKKPTKAQLKKMKEKEAKQKDNAEEDSDFGIDPYRSVPIPGQIAFCAECNCRFTVTPYSKEGSDGEGLLCHACGKKSAPIEKAQKKKKQVTRTNKKSTARALLDGDHSEVKTLQELCIQLVAKHIDDVEALGDIGSHNMDKICQIISKNRSLNDHTMKLFIEPAEHVLRFYDCSKIESDSLRQIGAFLPTLRHLRLKFCGRMRDDCLDYFGTQLKQLESFEIYGAFNVKEETYVRFFQNRGRTLKEFGVSDTSRFRAAAMEALVDNCPDLEVLRLKTLTNVDDECIRLLTGLPNLRVLEISEPSLDITDQPIIDILNTCGSALKELHLNGCFQLTDKLLEAIHSSCGQLEVLELEELDLLTNDGFRALFTNWSINSGLKVVNLTRCILLESSGFARMIDHSARTLEKLSVNSCKELETDAWDFVMEVKMPSLEEIDISFIRSVGDKTVEGLMKIAPKLAVVKGWGCFRLTEAVGLKEGLHLVGREADLLS